MVNRSTPLTHEGYRRFEAELNYLRKVRRSEVAERLRNAIDEGGELTENAEYEDAKNEQAFVEGRIQELEILLGNAVIIDDVGPEDIARLGSLVTVQEENGAPETYHIVGAAEANPREGRISNQSPLGQALLGKRVGDAVEVRTPDGPLTFRVVEIT